VIRALLTGSAAGLIAFALGLGAPAEAKPPRETPYSNEAMARKREARELIRETIREERRAAREEAARQPNRRRYDKDDCECEDPE
jgi:hypothetical protein